MLLTYWRVHLLYTLPVTTLLSLIVRPLLSKRNLFQIAFHVVLATLYTFPWDSYIIHNKAWWYADWAVTYTIAKVPIEEVFFFIIQSIFTSQLYLLIGLLETPSQHLLYISPFVRSPLHRRIFRWGPLLVLPLLGYSGWRYAIPETHTFYLGCITFWIVPISTFLWWIAGDHFLSRLRTSLLTIAIPTIYLCVVDTIALRTGTWHISEPTSTGIFVWQDLPIEEFTFFLVTNTLLVCGMSAFERCFAIIDVFGDLLLDTSTSSSTGVDETVVGQGVSKAVGVQYPCVPQPNLSNLGDLNLWLNTLVGALLLKPHELDSSHISRITSYASVRNLLAIHSKSFSTASYIFPPAVRRDLVILYAFCRVLDDFCDESATKEEAKQLISMARDFLDLVYPEPSARSSPFSVSRSKSLEKGDLSPPTDVPPAVITPLPFASAKPASNRPSDFAISCFLHKRVPTAARSAFFLLSTITSRVPRYPFEDLMAGYEWDLAGRIDRPIDTEADLIEYSRLVASSVAEMCVWAVWANEGSLPRDDQVRSWTLKKAADMGIALQITNIARDVREDASKGRIYLPKEWFSSIPTDAEKSTSSTSNSPSPSSPPPKATMSKTTFSRSSSPESDFMVLESAAKVQKPPNTLDFPYPVYIDRLLSLAAIYQEGTNEAILNLPRSCQAGLRAATRVYIGIGEEIRKRAFHYDGTPRLDFDGHRISLSKRQRVWIALQAVYTLY